jgi:hypothetical protein
MIDEAAFESDPAVAAWLAAAGRRAERIDLHVGPEWATIDLSFSGDVVGPLVMPLAAGGVQSVRVRRDGRGRGLRRRRHGSVDAMPHRRRRRN